MPARRAPELLTRRLRLREPRVGDAPAIFRAYASDPDVTRFLTWRPHERVEDTRTYLRQCRRETRAGLSLAWLVVSRRSDVVQGMVGLSRRKSSWELGYVLKRRAWGRGYMTEAVSAVLEHARSFDDGREVFARCNVDNPASLRVLEKVGFERTQLQRALQPNVGDGSADCWRCVLPPGSA